MMIMEDRRKPNGNNDELEVVKAAAWAWYRRGSRPPEPKPRPRLSSDDLLRHQRAHKPSRYKLEAAMEAPETASSSTYISQHQVMCNNLLESDVSLLDSYEIERISRELDYYIEASRLFTDGDLNSRRIASSWPESDVAAGTGTNNKKKKISAGNKKGKGFMIWRGVVCGSRDDVAKRGGGGNDGGGRRPGKKPVMVGVANCLPRHSATTHS